ncbi:pentapeptide repeat-containing protein [Cellulosilyticum sp. I15G10I2]|uniref:pentapeptide repeat-containing protein n=1 Tax=Cellulosilyticum sp. I15G10I2 TaxID=1892843 RepID=UPI00085BFC16|nr:pentapeptide repeat-containing protein [Cellulosilyticum sp. I15G10I2]
MAVNKNTANSFNYKNMKKLNKNFMYKDLKRSHCYDTDFSGSNFDYASFRGAHLKSCNFFECTFKSAEFVGTNLKKSKFKKARFENTLFESVNLDGVDFNGATFKNTIFLATDVTKAVNLNLKNADVRIFDEMPSLNLSEKLENAVKEAMKNDYIKASRVLDTKEGAINALSILVLLENFDEETLIKGLELAAKNLDKGFSTLSYIITFLKNYIAQELL